MTEKVASIIENFKKHFDPNNFKKLTVEDWENIFSNELSQTFSTKQYFIDPNFLYRARPNFDCNKKRIDFFKNVSDLLAPPHKKVKRQGRCNIPGQSLLYCSTNLTTTLFEIKPEEDSEITFIELKSLGKIGPLGVVGVKEVVTIANDYKRIFGDHFLNYSNETILLDDILSNVFKSKTENTEANPIYNLTNAITQIFLFNQKIASVPKHLIPPKFIGLIYPSVETEVILGINLVMQPKEVKHKLKPNIAYKYKILKCYAQHFYEIILTHKTIKIYPNGELVWELEPDSKIEYITDLPTVSSIAI